MPPVPILIYLAILISMVRFWFVAISKVFTYLARNHPEAFENIGSPHVIANNTPQNGIKSLRYLLGSGHKELNDSILNSKCAFLKKYFISYIVILCLPFLVVSIAANS